MPFAISYDTDIQCVCCRLTGTITMSMAKEFMEALVAELKQHDCRRVFNDAREAVIQIGSIDLINLPKTIAGIPELADSKRALVATPGTSGFEIFKTTSDIQGQNVCMFTTREEALAWLLDESE